MTGIFVLLIAGLTGITWWRLLQGKELARATAAKACSTHGLILMDDTVMLEAIQLRKKEPVRAWGLRYRFEFAHGGILQQGGLVMLTPGKRPTVVIETDNGPVIEEY